MTGDPSATAATGVELAGSATLSDSTVDTGGYGEFRSLYGARSVPGGSGTPTLEDTHFSNNYIGVEATTAVTLRRLRMDGNDRGVSAYNGGAITLTDSLIAMPSGASIGLITSDNNNIASSVASISADRVTIAGAGGGSRGVWAWATSTGDTHSITLKNSTVSGASAPLRCDAPSAGAASLTAPDSNYPNGGVQNNGCTTAPPATPPVAGDPGFVDAAGGDYRLRGDSPLVDAGDNSTLAGATDLDGETRPVDGDESGSATVDLGAYEYLRQAPGVSAAAAPVTAVTGQTVTFSATGTDADGEPLTYSWSFSDGERGPAHLSAALSPTLARTRPS